MWMLTNPIPRATASSCRHMLPRTSQSVSWHSDCTSGSISFLILKFQNRIVKSHSRYRECCQLKIEHETSNSQVRFKLRAYLAEHLAAGESRRHRLRKLALADDDIENLREDVCDNLMTRREEVCIIKRANKTHVLLDDFLRQQIDDVEESFQPCICNN